MAARIADSFVRDASSSQILITQPARRRRRATGAIRCVRFDEACRWPDPRADEPFDQDVKEIDEPLIDHADPEVGVEEGERRRRHVGGLGDAQGTGERSELATAAGRHGLVSARARRIVLGSRLVTCTPTPRPAIRRSGEVTLMRPRLRRRR